MERNKHIEEVKVLNSSVDSVSKRLHEKEQEYDELKAINEQKSK